MAQKPRRTARAHLVRGYSTAQPPPTPSYTLLSTRNRTLEWGLADLGGTTPRCRRLRIAPPLDSSTTRRRTTSLHRRTSSAILSFSSVVSPRLASPPFPLSSRVCHRPWLLPLPPEVPVVNQVVGDDVGLGAVVAGLVVEVEQHGAASTSLCLNLPSTSVSVDRLRICTC